MGKLGEEERVKYLALVETSRKRVEDEPPADANGYTALMAEIE